SVRSTLFPYTTLFRSVEGGQGDVDAFERLHEHRAGAAQIALPSARPEVAVERHLGALLPRHLDHGEKTSDRGVGIERERDAGERSEEHTSELQSRENI